MIRTILTSVFATLILSASAQTSDSLIVQTLRESNIRFSNNNSITLLMSGQEKFDDMFRAIRQAKSSIHLEYFNFRNDSIASLLFDLLREKRKEGVEVRAMFDGFGNDSNNQPLKKYHLEALREDSIDIVEYSPIRFPWVNHIFGRDHRKIVVIDGKIVSGVHGMGGEIGHIHIRDEDQDTCNCGGHGCLEQTASATGLVREAKRLLAANPENTSSMLEYGEKLEAKDIVACAVQGDELALKAIDTMSFYLGRALASIAMVVDPEVFIIGGGVSRAGKFLNDKIEKYYYEYAPLTGSKSEIVTALLGNDAGIYGAAKMVLD